MFVFGPALLLIGEWHVVALAAATATVGVTLLAASLSGYFLKPANWATRILFFTAAIVLIKPGILTDMLGIALATAGTFINLKWPAPERTPHPVPATGVGHVEAPSNAPIEPTDFLEAPVAHTSPKNA